MATSIDTALNRQLSRHRSGVDAVAFLDADNWYGQTIANLLAEMDQHQVDFISSDAPHALDGTVMTAQ